MPRKKKDIQIPGQLSLEPMIAEPMSLKGEHWVVQANPIITGKQSLNLNSAKLIRAAVMQIKPDEKELKPYRISMPQLSKLLGVDNSNLHHNFEDIRQNIYKNPLFIKDDTKGWVEYQWVTHCAYFRTEKVVEIQLNHELKPLLISLQERYTQYRFENIVEMRSVYAIRLFELIQERIKRKVSSKGVDVELKVDDIRKACNCEKKYTKFSHFHERIIDAGEKEINRCTFYNVSHEYIKTGRQVTAILFHVSIY